MELIPSWLLSWFWLFGAAVMVVNAGIIYLRAAPLERSGRVTRDDRRRFALGLAGWTAGFCLLIQVVVWVGGESRPECLAAFPPETPVSVATTALTLLGWLVLLIWVWRGRGASTLGRFAPAFAPGGAWVIAPEPAKVRRVVTGLIAITLVGSIVASRIAPAPPDCVGRSAVSGLW
jgi:hypothetical protein